jgi:hypothetical protein
VYNSEWSEEHFTVHGTLEFDAVWAYAGARVSQSDGPIGRYLPVPDIYPRYIDLNATPTTSGASLPSGYYEVPLQAIPRMQYPTELHNELSSVSEAIISSCVGDNSESVAEELHRLSAIEDVLVNQEEDLSSMKQSLDTISRQSPSGEAVQKILVVDDLSQRPIASELRHLSGVTDALKRQGDELAQVAGKLSDVSGSLQTISQQMPGKEDGPQRVVILDDLSKR